METLRRRMEGAILLPWTWVGVALLSAFGWYWMGATVVAVFNIILFVLVFRVFEASRWGIGIAFVCVILWIIWGPGVPSALAFVGHAILLMVSLSPEARGTTGNSPPDRGHPSLSRASINWDQVGSSQGDGGDGQ